MNEHVAEPMADPAALPPVSPDDPCGPDLDLDGDMDFLNYSAATEGQLPSKYYDFDREKAELPEAIETGRKLLQRTHDIRLLVLLAKLSILNRDIAGFARWVGTIAWLLRAHWDDVHPKAEGGDFSMRLMQLLTLEDPQVVLLPLKYAPLLETSREGSLSFRAQLVATGKETPRVVTRINAKGEQEVSADEKFMPGSTIERLLRDIEIGKLAAVFETLSGLGAALDTIKKITVERVGSELAAQLPKLAELVRDMTQFAQAALVKRDPTLAPAPAPAEAGDNETAEADAGPAGPPPAFATPADVDAALGAALAYFSASEPSSPAVLLIGQARETLGKNLYEVMKLLAPAHADGARLFVGLEGAFTVPVRSLSSAPSVEISRAEPEPAPTRAAALALIDAVAAHMSRAEPSSPAPYLLERARNLATRDFLSLLHDVLPEDAIAALKKGK